MARDKDTHEDRKLLTGANRGIGRELLVRGAVKIHVGARDIAPRAELKGRGVQVIGVLPAHTDTATGAPPEPRPPPAKVAPEALGSHSSIWRNTPRGHQTASRRLFSVRASCGIARQVDSLTDGRCQPALNSALLEEKGLPPGAMKKSSPAISRNVWSRLRISNPSSARPVP